MIGRIPVGRDHPPVLIAEAGVNHNGDIGLAIELIDASADAGADVVKFQTFTAAAIASAEAPLATYQKVAKGGGETQREMLARLELSLSDFERLMAHCGTRGIEFLSTPFDEESATALVDMGMCAVKVPSGEITNHRLLRHVVGLGRPLIISTGMATLAEVSDAIAVVRAVNPSAAFSLLHCVSCYPAAPAEMNLRAMRTLELEFGVPVGLSDHTLGTDIAIGAVALGAAIIEKHVTLDRSMTGPDHAASLEPAELAALVKGMRAVHVALGDGVKRPSPCEGDTAGVARRSLASARDLGVGERLQQGDIAMLRPGTGLAPSEESTVIGRAMRVSVSRGTLLTREMFE